MKMKQLFAGALVALLGLPVAATAAQSTESEPIVINGSLVNWYYYGKDIHSSSQGWWEMPVGLGTADDPYNIGLISLAVNPSDKKKAWVCGFPIRNHILYSNAGGVFTGDAYYSFYMGMTDDWIENVEQEYGTEEYIVKVRKWTWDGVDENGDYTNVKYEQVATMKSQPIDLTYDPYNDIVYGIFYNGNTYKFGTLDMETFEISYISREGIVYGAPQCIAINSKGEIYAIDASGYVYKVNKTNGVLSTIGNVGFKSQPRRMSATFDLRTDKLYWVGFMNDGKKSAATDGSNNTLTVAEGGRDTGIYEVNTETGEATLVKKTDWTDSEPVYDENGDVVDYKVNKYGKMQLTGIYVEGSFTRKEVDQSIMIINCPEQLRKGEAGTVEVRVKNLGTKRVRGRDYKVNCYVDGQLIGTIDNDGEDIYTTDLEVGKSTLYSFSFQATHSGQLQVYAEVVNEKDEESRNNKTAVKEVIVFNEKLLPQVKLEGEALMRGITLTWSDPDGHIVDGAEDYAAFTYQSVGEWTMVDGDKGYTQKPNNFNESVNYPNWSTPKAYIVFNPVKAGFDLAVGGEKFNPYAGSQYFAAFFTAVPDDSEAGGHQIPNNDWMISPELSGKAQTISFMAKGYKGLEATGYVTEANYPEKMRVLYSMSSTDTTTFVVAVDTFVVNNEAWTRYEANLPEGAKYFVLQCVSDEGYVLLIDEIEFQVEPLEVKGYKLYRNGVLEKEFGPQETTFTDGRASKSDLFTVVAVYEEGESNPSNAISVDLLNGVSTGINKVQDTDSVVTEIYNLRGQRVNSMNMPGIYVVKKGNTVQKLIKK